MTLNLDDRVSDDLIIAAIVLNDNGYFKTTQDIIEFFEKPWKWKEEYNKISEEEE